MRNRILSIILISALTCFVELKAQCTPDTTLNTTGVYPAVLSKAIIHQPYQQVIQYHMTEDTLIFVKELNQTVLANLDTVWIAGVVGLPDGFTYTCHNADCKITGGSTGCATLSGTATPSQWGTYPLQVLLKIRATANIGFPVSRIIYDTISRYSIEVGYPSGIKEDLDESQIQVFPNPAKDQISLSSKLEMGSGSYKLTDIKGGMLLSGDLELKAGSQTDIPLIGIAPGLYFLQIQHAQKMHTRKIRVE